MQLQWRPWRVTPAMVSNGCCRILQGLLVSLVRFRLFVLLLLRLRLLLLLLLLVPLLLVPLLAHLLLPLQVFQALPRNDAYPSLSLNRHL